MEVTYTLDETDLRSLDRHLSKSHYPRIERMAFILLGCIIIGIILNSILRDKTGRDLWRIFLACSPLAAIVAIAYFGFQLLKKRACKETMSTPGFADQRVFQIAPEHVYIRDGLGEETTKWQRMHSIVNDSDHLFFFVTQTHAFIVPKRAFATSAEAQKFYETALEFWKTANNQ